MKIFNLCTSVLMNTFYRLGDVDDIAGIVAFLASNDAAYITGETIVAAGGMPSRL